MAIRGDLLPAVPGLVMLNRLVACRGGEAGDFWVLCTVFIAFDGLLSDGEQEDVV